jgi:hypothetical protein
MDRVGLAHLAGGPTARAAALAAGSSQADATEAGISAVREAATGDC